MKPRKKSYIDLIIVFISLVLVLYFSLQLSASWNQYELAKTTATDNVNAFSVLLADINLRLTEKIFEFEWNDYSQSFLTFGFLIWLMGVAYFTTTKKNFITGKEYGTARWGKKSDIQDLFAENIEREEIKKAKKESRFWSRYFMKWQAVRQAKKDCKVLYSQKLKELSDRADMLKKEGSYSRDWYKAELEKIKKEVEEQKRLALLEAWKPDKYKWQLKERIHEIQSNATYTEDEKRKEIQKAQNEYREKIRSFYNRKEKIQKIKDKYKDADMLLTKTERISLYNYKLNNNILVLGGSGSGKTRGFVMPNLLQAHSSYVITDPKGEILEKAGYFLEKIKGYKIRVLNLDDKLKSDGYNPFVYIHPEREGYEERVLSLIEAIIINTDGGEKKGSTDPFWDKAERLFLQAIFFFTCDGFVEEERNMNTVLELIGMLKIEEDEDNYDSDLDYFVEIFEREHGSDHIGVQQYREFRSKASGKTAKSIVISAVARLAPFRTAAIRQIFEKDTLHLDRIGEEKTALFVVVPPTDNTFNFIAGMMFTQLFQELQYCATQVHKHEGQRLPVPCRFILDEFANTCTIPNFVKILAYARSFGIGIVPILQSLEQIKNMYKDEWGVIVDNCNSLLYLGSISHMDTLEYMSKLIGKATFDKRTTGRTRGRQGSSSQNFDVIGRELMDVSEIRKLPKEHCLLIIGGKDAFYSAKYDYTSHPNYRYTSDANPSYSYEFTPARELEESDIEDPVADFDENFEFTDEDFELEIEKILVDDDLKNMVNRLSKSIQKQIPVDDEELVVDDGEMPDLSEEEILISGLEELAAEEYQEAETAEVGL